MKLIWAKAIVQFIHFYPMTNPELVKFSKKEWFGFLDGIRGLAALYVLISHCIMYAGWNGPLKSGALAVDVFMIVSGFLMACHYRDRESSQPWESPKTWYIFYVRRFFRIAPLYYLLLIPALVFHGYFCYQNSINHSVNSVLTSNLPTNFTVTSIGIVQILAHLTFTFGFIPQYASALILPDWSLSLEMQFYLAFPFIMLLLKRFSYFWPSILLVITGSIANAFFYHGFTQPSFLPFKIIYFLIGILLAESHYFRFSNSWLSTALMVFSIVLSAYTRKNEAITFIVSLIAILLFYNRQKNLLKINQLVLSAEKALSSRIATFMADTSYSVYLFHLLLLSPLTGALSGTSWYLSLPGLLKFLLVFTIVACITYCVAFILYKFIEKPGIRLGQMLVKKYLLKEKARVL